jgi:bacterioferritin-associated ferredoxin
MLERIVGHGHVTAADIGRRIACDTLVHAGPWIADPNLAFQAAADGKVRLARGALPANVRLIGGAALPDEPVHVGDLADARFASICPCMDVMGAEILDLMAAGMTHVEELKRQTSCGMGPCQGLPCWEMLRALLRKASNGRHGDDRPSHRGPRRALTVAQAAGLDGLVEPQQ